MLGFGKGSREGEDKEVKASAFEIKISFGDDSDEDVDLERDEQVEQRIADLQHKIDALIEEVQVVLDAEQGFYDECYEEDEENDRYQQAEENIDALENAISYLEDASSSLSSVCN